MPPRRGNIKLKIAVLLVLCLLAYYGYKLTAESIIEAYERGPVILQRSVTEFMGQKSYTNSTYGEEMSVFIRLMSDPDIAPKFMLGSTLLIVGASAAIWTLKGIADSA